MRFDFLDFPTAWEIQREVGEQLVHDPRCSSQPPHGGAMWLCDCDAVPAEWGRRRAEHKPSSPDLEA